MTALPPGSTIGMLGAGQLGRMTALAAARLGYRLHVFSPEGQDSSCGQVCAEVTTADWHDQEALARFADAVDVVTLEWENVPTGTVDLLAGRVPVHPGSGVLAVAQDRLREKAFANAQGLRTAPFRPVRSAAELKDAVAELGTPSILKSTRLGYDGKGQVRIHGTTNLDRAWAELCGSGSAGTEGILEGFVTFACEVSVIVARRADGAMVSYPPVENRHKAGILDVTIAPAGIDGTVAAEARRVAERLAESLGVVGLLAVEMFVTADGAVLVNEVAPRPHNSGHWSIDFCETSQFEQLVRAVCGLPLGPTGIIEPCAMTNLIGDDVNAWPVLAAEPGARLHLYGKGEARPGRKMGHVTRPLTAHRGG